MIKVSNANEKVIAIFPVTFIPIGVSQNKFRKRTKKKIVSKKLMYFL